MWSTYVLRSLADGRFYIGMTSQAIVDRLARHNAGRVRSTRGRRPFRLLHSETFATAREAGAGEKHLKSGVGHEFMRKRFGGTP